MNVKDQVSCRITGIQPYGVFVECDDYIGLIHISEISDQYVPSLEAMLDIGDIVEAVVLEVDENQKRLKLSYKEANPIHPRIQKIVKIQKGFHSLSKALPFWIEKTKK